MVVRAVAIDGDIDVGFFQRAFVGKTQTEVLDGEAAVEPHLLVVGADGAQGGFIDFIRRAV